MAVEIVVGMLLLFLLWLLWLSVVLLVKTVLLVKLAPRRIEPHLGRIHRTSGEGRGWRGVRRGSGRSERMNRPFRSFAIAFLVVVIFVVVVVVVVVVVAVAVLVAVVVADVSAIAGRRA